MEKISLAALYLHFAALESRDSTIQADLVCSIEGGSARFFVGSNQPGGPAIAFSAARPCPLEARFCPRIS